MSKRDYYEILGVGRDAAQDEIKRKFRNLAREFHPDVNNEPHAEDKFKEINEAYSILGDEEKRAKYDRFGHDGINDNGMPTNMDDIFGFGGMNDVFDAFFGGGGRSGGRQAYNGRDLRVDVDVTLMEALTGVEREVTVRRSENCHECNGTGAAPGSKPRDCSHCNGTGQVRRIQQTFIGSMTTVVPCSNCRGTGKIIEKLCSSCNGQKNVNRDVKFKVKVPPGVDNGLTLRYPNEGDAGIGGGRAGDLYVVLSMEQDKKFHREGTELYTQAIISFAKAALGGKIIVKGLDGEYPLTVKPGTQTGAELFVDDAGMPELGGKRRGDLHVHLKVSVPEKLSKEQKELLRQFAEISGENMDEINSGKGFFEQVKERLIGD